MPRLIRVFARCTGHFVGFIVLRFTYVILVRVSCISRIYRSCIYIGAKYLDVSIESFFHADEHVIHVCFLLVGLCVWFLCVYMFCIKIQHFFS